MSTKKLREATSKNKDITNIEKTLSAYEPRQIIQTISTLKNLISPITSNIEHRKIVEKQISDFLQSKQQILHSISQVFYEFGMIDLKNITNMIKAGQVPDVSGPGQDVKISEQSRQAQAQQTVGSQMRPQQK